MKITTNNQPNGSVILITLLTGFVVGLTLASYLTMVSVQNQSTLRSLAWNSSVPTTEAGVEEALTALYYYGTTNLVTGGWVNNVDGFWHKTGDLGSGYSYDVGIKPPVVGGPDRATIESFGYAPAPANLATSYLSPYGMILGGLVPSYSPTVVSAKRKVRVMAQRQSPLNYAMLAKGMIDLNGNNIATDSFDSTDPKKSGTGGKYDASKSADKGDVATNLGIVDSINVGNADIRGHVSTGPGGSVAVGSNGAIGDKDWVTYNNGIEPGWVSDDANVDIPDAKIPRDFSTNARTPTAAKTEYPAGSGNFYDYVLFSADYRIKDFKGTVLVVGAARVLVESSFNFSGADGITISSGASLQVYVAPASASLGGNGVQNQGDAMSFIYWGLNSNTTLSFGGNSTFTGVIYAPYADFKLGGSGSGNYDFVGAAVIRTVTMTGHFHFHYDESLARRFPIQQYVVYSWNDINPNN